MIINTFAQVSGNSYYKYTTAGLYNYACPATAQVGTTSAVTATDATQRLGECGQACSMHTPAGECVYFQYESDLTKSPADCKLFSSACAGLSTYDATVLLYEMYVDGAAYRCFGADLLESPALTATDLAGAQTECSGYCDAKNSGAMPVCYHYGIKTDTAALACELYACPYYGWLEAPGWAMYKYTGGGGGGTAAPSNGGGAPASYASGGNYKCADGQRVQPATDYPFTTEVTAQTRDAYCKTKCAEF